MPDTSDRTGALYPQSWSQPGSAERNAPPIASALSPLLSSLSSPSSPRRPIDVLEIASGFGVQLAHIATRCHDARFWPTEADERLRREIDATMERARSDGSDGLDNVEPAAVLEVDKQHHWRTAALRISKCQVTTSEGAKGAEGATAILTVVLAFNLVHIVPWHVVRSLFAQLDPRLRYMAYKPREEAHDHEHGHTHTHDGDNGEEGEMIERRLLDPTNGRVVLYGPFKRHGKILTEGDDKFDATLKSRDPAFGLRDLEGEILPLAKTHGWELHQVTDMPAGNFLVVLCPASR